MKAGIALVTVCIIVSLSIIALPVQAQDYYDRYKPTLTPPSISVTSPQNNSIINTNSILLIFNVSGPQVIDISPDVTRYSSHLFRVSYRGDWQNEEQFYDAKPESLDFLEFNTTLSGIPDGTHELQITAIGEVGFTVAMFGFSYYPDANASIVFTINPITTTPSTEPFPQHYFLIFVGITLVVIGVPVYFKKHHPKTGGKT